MHFLLRTLPSHHPIGVIRFNPPAPPAPSASDHSHPSESSGTKLGRLAVLKAHRGKGHGDRLVNAVHDWVKENPQSAGAQVTSGEKIDTNNETDQQQDAMIWLHAQLPVKKFYSR
jgi:GNAT superfamily N-acetyltransferase